MSKNTNIQDVIKLTFISQWLQKEAFATKVQDLLTHDEIPKNKKNFWQNFRHVKYFFDNERKEDKSELPSPHAISTSESALVSRSAPLVKPIPLPEVKVEEELKIQNQFSEKFIEENLLPIPPHHSDVRLVAFYLPQYHPFKENNMWWGKGFTEWTNVTKTKPNFEGHHQPQLPIDLGFYDLRAPGVFERQIELAKQYGIFGFCFHYYWFSGKRLMEEPIFHYLRDKKLNHPFCLCWANEPWSRRWDGSENDVLMPQKLLDDDDEKFIDDAKDFLLDERYIRIEGKPVLIIYRPNLWSKERVRSLTENWRKTAKEKYGVDGLYLMGAQSFRFQQEVPGEWGFDAAVEFPPHGMHLESEQKELYPHHWKLNRRIRDLSVHLASPLTFQKMAYTLFKTVFPAWDNTARKGNSSSIFLANQATYEEWLQKAIQYTCENNAKTENIVFINAWNEWGEGAHLEPDSKNGYAMLEATRNVLLNSKTIPTLTTTT